MDSIATLTEALSALKESQNRAFSLDADLKAAQALMEEQAVSISALKQELEAVKSAAQHVEAVSELRLNEVLAGVGVAPVDVPIEANAAPQKTREELWAEYRSLDLYSRNAFYQTHRAQLSTLKK